VVIYDDVPAGNHAIGVLAKLFREPEDRADLRPELWRFDFLDHPDWFALALVGAINADIVVISTSSAHGLNASLENWITLCLTRKRGTRAAVVALFGSAESADGPASARLQFVQDAAREAGLDFFAPAPAAN
jgi:hypothetical protein